MRKPAAPDAGSDFGPLPEPIASVSSRSFTNTLRQFSTITISQPLVSSGFFYWVELDFNGGAIEVTGVRINTATTC